MPPRKLTLCHQENYLAEFVKGAEDKLLFARPRLLQTLTEKIANGASCHFPVIYWHCHFAKIHLFISAS